MFVSIQEVTSDHAMLLQEEGTATNNLFIKDPDSIIFSPFFEENIDGKIIGYKIGITIHKNGVVYGCILSFKEKDKCRDALELLQSKVNNGENLVITEEPGTDYSIYHVDLDLVPVLEMMANTFFTQIDNAMYHLIERDSTYSDYNLYHGLSLTPLKLLEKISEDLRSITKKITKKL